MKGNMFYKNWLMEAVFTVLIVIDFVYFVDSINEGLAAAESIKKLWHFLEAAGWAAVTAGMCWALYEALKNDYKE